MDRVSLRTRLTASAPGREGLTLELPLLAAAMQSVSGPALAKALGRRGGLAVVFCSQSPEDEAAMVREIKASTPPILAAAAINTHDHEVRAPALVEAGVDLLFLDASDGFSVFQAETLARVHERWPHLPVVGGNIVTGRAFDFLVEAGADAVKVGMGSGSICITQEQKGTGRGLASALIDVCAARDRHIAAGGRYIPVIADGGIVVAKDMVMALAIGADAVMLGRWFARVEESPNLARERGGRRFKPYWGEGAARARAWKQARYDHGLFEEGVEGWVECVGPLDGVLDESLAMIRASMSCCGARDIPELHAVAELERVSEASIHEGRPHDILLGENP